MKITGVKTHFFEWERGPMHWRDGILPRPRKITKAEGSRQSQILEAEGSAEAVKLEADAEKYRRIQVAQGESEAIQKVFDAIHAGKPNNELITLKYLEMLPKLAEGEANKVFLPFEASGMISSLAAMVEGIKDKKGSGGSPTVASVS